MRIAPIQPPYDEQTAAALAKWMLPGSAEPLALFRILVRHSELSERLRPLGAFNLGKSSGLEVRDREIVIDRVCALCGCEYEWGVHVAAFGARAGLTPEKLTATVSASPDDPVWSDREATLIRFVDALHQRAAIADDLWASLRHTWTELQIIELTALAGFYHLISFVANVAQVPLESWAARFPA